MQHYRLATYDSDRGPRAAILMNGHARDAAEATGQPGYASVLSILEDWDNAARAIAEAVEAPTAEAMPVSEMKFLPPVLYPGTIYCAGANYQDHMDAVAKHRGLPPQPSPKDIGVGPFFFLKARRSVVGPDSDVVNESKAFDFEIELAVVIGRKGARRLQGRRAGLRRGLHRRERLFRARPHPSAPTPGWLPVQI